MKTYGDALDPKMLIAESYRIDGITPEECRSIFLDWALSLRDGAAGEDAAGDGVAGDGVAVLAALPALIARHSDAPDHPMTAVLREGLDRLATPTRRGGWRSRPR